MDIAHAVLTDQDDVVQLLLAQFAEHEIATGETALRPAVAGMIADPQKGAILVARVEKQIVGVAVVSFTWTVEHGGKAAWLDELYVVPAWREKGVGTALLTQALEAARSAGCLAMDLEVEEAHQRVEGLYQRYGFLPHTRRRFYQYFT